MGEAILKGILANRISSQRSIFVSDTDSFKLNRIKHQYKIAVTLSNSLVAQSSDTVIIAVKPQDIAAALKVISGYLDRDKLLISVAAGVTIKKISSAVGHDTPVVRAMPNMPALVNKGFTALSFSRGVSSERARFTVRIFSSLGDTVVIKEKDMDAITAISGSGPAYFFYLVETLIENGIKLGLNRDIAIEASVKTAIGSTQLLKDSPEDAAALRRRVTSKGGTTEAAFKVFEKRGLGGILEKGIKAARDRARELSGG